MTPSDKRIYCMQGQSCTLTSVTTFGPPRASTWLRIPSVIGGSPDEGGQGMAPYPLRSGALGSCSGRARNRRGEAWNGGGGAAHHTVWMPYSEAP